MMAARQPIEPPELPTPVTAVLAREVIALEGGRLHEYAAQAEALLRPEVYVRGGRLVRIGASTELTGTVGAALRRDVRQPVVLGVTQEYLRRRLNERAEFQAYRRREKEWVPVDCPNDLAGNILGAGDWPTFRPLTAIATAPFIRPDLTVCETPGYDDATGIYLAPTEPFPAMPTKPTRADATVAWQRLLAPFAEFPFDGPESLSVFMSHVLTAAVRVALGTVPAFFYTAPIAATGKTFLSGFANLIAHGAQPAMRPYTDESEELRKVLFAALLAGDPAVTFDNVPAGVRVRSPILCGFITASTYSDRKLGSSESRQLPNRVLVTLTGNNVTPSGDLPRRALVCRLDADAETPRGREFKIPNLAAHVAELRPQLLVDALTIIRAYLEAGAPKVDARPLESFEAWSLLARDPLMWLDMADPVGSQAVETDDEIAPLRAAFDAIAENFRTGAGEFTARQLAAACNGFGEAISLRSTIEAAGCSDATCHVKIGYWLRANRGRVAGQRKLTNRAGHAGVAFWTVNRK